MDYFSNFGLAVLLATDIWLSWRLEKRVKALEERTPRTQNTATRRRW